MLEREGLLPRTDQNLLATLYVITPYHPAVNRGKFTHFAIFI
jgi:hypothetical protein